MNHLADLVSKNLGRFDSFPPWRKPKIRLHDPIVTTKESKEKAGPKRRHIEQVKFAAALIRAMLITE